MLYHVRGKGGQVRGKKVSNRSVAEMLSGGCAQVCNRHFPRGRRKYRFHRAPLNNVLKVRTRKTPTREGIIFTAFLSGNFSASDRWFLQFLTPSLRNTSLPMNFARAYQRHHFFYEFRGKFMNCFKFYIFFIFLSLFNITALAAWENIFK